MDAIMVTKGALLAIAAIVAVVGFMHMRGMINFFRKRKTGAQVGTVLLVVGVVLGLAAYGTPIPGIDSVFDIQEASVGGTLSPSEEAAASASGLTVQTLTVTVKEAGSDSRSAADGFLRIYESGVNPSGATATPLDTVTIHNGAGSSTANLVQEGVQYRVVWEGNSTGTNYYDKDLGVMSFSGLNPNTGVLTFDVGEVQLVGTLSDIINENSTDLNGQAAGSNIVGTGELGCTAGCAADEEVIYDESVGDGVWYLDLTAEVTGANSVAKDAVLVFKHDLTNPPEGNEYSQITSQLRSGTDMVVPSDITNYWANEIPIELGTIQAGQSADYRFTFSVTEANEDGNDDWTLRFDDLGDHLGKDIRLNTRATADTFTYGGSQA